MDATNSNTNTNANVNGSIELNEFDTELLALRTANFDYIFAFKRKDAKPLNSEDKRFVKNNSHASTNRFTKTDDDTVVFAGSNYRFPEEGLRALKERFEVQDFSKPEEFLEQRRKESREKEEKEKKKKAVPTKED